MTDKPTRAGEMAARIAASQERNKADRWGEGSLADEVSRLVFGVEPYNRDVVRGFCDRIWALEQEVAKHRPKDRPYRFSCNWLQGAALEREVTVNRYSGVVSSNPRGATATMRPITEHGAVAVDCDDDELWRRACGRVQHWQAHRHTYAETLRDRDDHPIPPTCAHCGRAKAYCEGEKP